MPIRTLLASSVSHRGHLLTTPGTPRTISFGVQPRDSGDCPNGHVVSLEEPGSQTAYSLQVYRRCPARWLDLSPLERRWRRCVRPCAWCCAHRNICLCCTACLLDPGSGMLGRHEYTEEAHMFNPALHLRSLFSRGSPPSNAAHAFDANTAALAAHVVATPIASAEAGDMLAARSPEATPRWRTARPPLRPGATSHLRYPLGTSARPALDDRAAARLHDTQ